MATRKSGGFPWQTWLNSAAAAFVLTLTLPKKMQPASKRLAIE